MMTGSVQLPPIRPSGTVRDQIIRALTGAIERGELKPGMQLPPERDLAAMLGVSRSAARDAIKTLAGAGMIEVRHGYGTFVSAQPGGTPLDARLRLRSSQLRDLFEMRLLLEVQAAQWAAERLEAGARAELTAFLETLDELDETTSLARLHDLDREFHGMIAEATGNQTMAMLMYNLLELLSNVRSLSLQLPGRAIQSVAEHRLISQAILAGDGQAAQSLMEGHIRSVEDSLRDALGVRSSVPGDGDGT